MVLAYRDESLITRRFRAPLTVHDLTEKSEAEMMKVRNLGRKSLEEVKPNSLIWVLIKR